MRRNGPHLLAPSLVMVALACAPVGEDWVPPETLEHYLEVELERLEETYRLLDRFAQDVWPQWDNYHEIEVRVHFPNDVRLWVNPRGAVESGYERVQGRDVCGKPILINREKALPVLPEPPLVVGRGRGGLTIRIKLRPLELRGEGLERVRIVEEQLEAINQEETEFSIDPTGDSES